MIGESRWVAQHIPRLDGRVAVVTGANSGLGSHTARYLAGRGATVVLACRDVRRAEPVVARIEAAGGGAVASLLDLSDLSTVKDFAATTARQFESIDILVNNAGVMAIPRMLTVDGFERQLGVNHLGHFALTGLLLGQLRASPGARVVTVSSFLARSGRIRFEDLQSEASYDPWAAYSQSKLANLLFARELARRLSALGACSVASVAVHPGYSATSLVANGPGAFTSRFERVVFAAGNAVLAQRAAGGALPSVMAAGGAPVGTGEYWGPRGPLHLRGRPTRLRVPRRGRDETTAERLWGLSEELTGVRFSRS